MENRDQNRQLYEASRTHDNQVANNTHTSITTSLYSVSVRRREDKTRLSLPATKSTPVHPIISRLPSNYHRTSNPIQSSHSSHHLITHHHSPPSLTPITHQQTASPSPSSPPSRAQNRPDSRYPPQFETSHFGVTFFRPALLGTRSRCRLGVEQCRWLILPCTVAVMGWGLDCDGEMRWDGRLGWWAVGRASPRSGPKTV